MAVRAAQKAGHESFATATSTGQLPLNMLLTFAQLEREETTDRVRDKIAASKRGGLWMGGNVPLGFDPDGRTLKLNSAEATTIRTLYDLYGQLSTVREVNAFRFSLSMIKSKKSAAFRDQRAELP